MKRQINLLAILVIGLVGSGIRGMEAPKKFSWWQRFVNMVTGRQGMEAPQEIPKESKQETPENFFKNRPLLTQAFQAQIQHALKSGFYSLASQLIGSGVPLGKTIIDQLQNPPENPLVFKILKIAIENGDVDTINALITKQREFLENNRGFAWLQDVFNQSVFCLSVNNSGYLNGVKRNCQDKLFTLMESDARDRLNVNHQYDIQDFGFKRIVTPLGYAAELGLLPHVQALLTHPQIEINEADDQGRTALHIAVDKCNIDAVRFLLDAGADINAQTKIDKDTPLNLAIGNSGWVDKDKNRAIMELLLADPKLDLTKKTKNGWTAYGLAEQQLIKEDRDLFLERLNPEKKKVVSWWDLLMGN